MSLYRGQNSKRKVARATAGYLVFALGLKVDLDIKEQGRLGRPASQLL